MTEPPAEPPAPDEDDAAFVAVMEGAREQAADGGEAPFGYTRDRSTGETRPKKSPGRGGVKPSPTVEEMKAADAAAAAEAGPPPKDRAPSTPSRKQARANRAVGRPEVPYHQGQITRGMNRLHRQAGKMVRAIDADIGTALIEMARNTAEDGDPDDSVGAAWDEVARTNPRIRRFCLTLVSGGAYGRLIMAHTPLLLVILTKTSIAERIPFGRFLMSMAEPDEDTPAGEGGLPGGMTADDVAQMAAMADQFAGQFAAKTGIVVPPEVLQQAQAAAAGTGNGVPPPEGRPGPGRSQPRRQRRRPG